MKHKPIQDDQYKRYFTVIKELEDSEDVKVRPRQELANKYTKGNGIEIGARHNPLTVDNESVKVRYVDRKPIKTLREHYKELEQGPLITPDIIASVEDLSVIQDSSQDFLIANHLLEHSPNPVKALKEFHRVVKKHHGNIFLALPNTMIGSSSSIRKTWVWHMLVIMVLEQLGVNISCH